MQNLTSSQPEQGGGSGRRLSTATQGRWMAQGIVSEQVKPVVPRGYPTPYMKTHISVTQHLLHRFAAYSCVLTPKGPGTFLPKAIFPLFICHGHFFTPSPPQRRFLVEAAWAGHAQVPGSSEPVLAPAVKHTSPLLQETRNTYFRVHFKAYQHLKTSDNRQTTVRL